MKLKLGFHTLNEELSLIVFEQLNAWYKKYFNEELDEKKCQRIIDEYNIVVTADKAIKFQELIEYTIIRVTIKHEKIKQNLMLKAPFFDYYLGTYIKKLNTKNDPVFEEIIRFEDEPF